MEAVDSVQMSEILTSPTPPDGTSMLAAVRADSLDTVFLSKAILDISTVLHRAPDTQHHENGTNETQNNAVSSSPSFTYEWSSSTGKQEAKRESSEARLEKGRLLMADVAATLLPLRGSSGVEEEQPSMCIVPVDATHYLISRTSPAHDRRTSIHPREAHVNAMNGDRKEEKPPMRSQAILLWRHEAKEGEDSVHQKECEVQEEEEARLIRGLPLRSFQAYVRDYTAQGLALNASVLEAAWTAKLAQGEAREDGNEEQSNLKNSTCQEESKIEISLGDAATSEKRKSNEKEEDEEEGEKREGESAHEIAVKLGHDLDAAATDPTLHDDDDGEAKEEHSAQDTATSTSTTTTKTSGRHRAEAAVLWEEEQRLERYIALQLRHRFLVADAEQHAIWALEVHLPTMGVRVVGPTEFAGEAPPDETIAMKQSLTAHSEKGHGEGERVDSPELVRPVEEQDKERSGSRRSHSRSVDMVKAMPAPLLGGGRGFVDGHFSIARFHRPTSLCWRTDAAISSFSSSSSSPGGPLSLFSRQSACEVLFIGDSGNAAIRYANFQNQFVRTVAGVSGVPGYRDGSCVSSMLREATAMAWCSAGLLFTDGPNGALRLITNLAKPSASHAPKGAKKVIPTGPSPPSPHEEEPGAQAPKQVEEEAGEKAKERSRSNSPSSLSRLSGGVPRVWTLSGSSPSTSHAAHNSSAPLNGSAVTYVDSAMPSRACFGFLSDFALVLGEEQPDREGDEGEHDEDGKPSDAANVSAHSRRSVAPVHQILLLDHTNHAVRVLDGTGVHTFVGPLDYASPSGAPSAASLASHMPRGLLFPSKLVAFALVKERSPVLFLVDKEKQNGAPHSAAPLPYLQSASLAMVVGSAVTGTVNMMLPVSRRQFCCPLTDPHHPAGDAGVGEDALIDPVEAARLLGLGIASEGRRTIGELSLPTLKHTIFKSPSHTTSVIHEDEEEEQVDPWEATQQAVAYVRARFPWLLPPSVPQLSKELLSFSSCHVSGRRHGQRPRSGFSPGSDGLPPTSPSPAAAASRPPLFSSPQQSRARTMDGQQFLSSEGISPPAPTIIEVVVNRSENEGEGTHEEGNTSTAQECSPTTKSRRRHAAEAWLTPPQRSLSRSPRGSPAEDGVVRRASSSPSPASYADRFQQLPEQVRQQRVLNAQELEHALGCRGEEEGEEEHRSSEGGTTPRGRRSTSTAKPVAGSSSPPRRAGSSSVRRGTPLTPRSMAAHQLMQRRRPSQSQSQGRVESPPGTVHEPLEDEHDIIYPPLAQTVEQVILSAYDDAVRKLFTVYEFFATKEVEVVMAPIPSLTPEGVGGRRWRDGRAAERHTRAIFPSSATQQPRRVERYSMPLLALARFLILTGYLPNATGLSSAGPRLARCEGPQQSGGGKSAKSGVLLPLTARDWRCVTAVLHDCGVRTRGYHKLSCMDFQSFRRLVLLLHTWCHLCREQHQSDTEGEKTHKNNHHENARRDIFEHIDEMPLLDFLSTEEVIAAYTDVYDRALLQIPAFACATEQTMREGAASPDSPDVSCSPPVSPIHPAHSLGELADATEQPEGGLHSVIRRSSPPPQEQPAQHQRLLALDDVLFVLQRNGSSLEQLFEAYSLPFCVQRTKGYAPPPAAAAAATVSRPALISPAERSGASLLIPPPSGSGKMCLVKSTAATSSSARARCAHEEGVEAAVHRRYTSSTAHDILWKMQQLFTIHAKENADVQRRTSVSLPVMRWKQFKELWMAVDVCPALVSRAALEQCFIDALSMPLLSSAAAVRSATERYHQSASSSSTTVSLDLVSLPLITAAEGAGAANKNLKEAEELNKMAVEILLADGALTYLAFVEAFVRVAMTVFSHEVDLVAYPTAAAKTNGLMQWINTQVARGFVDKRRRMSAIAVKSPRAAGGGAEGGGLRGAAVTAVPSSSLSAKGSGTFPVQFKLFSVRK